jgi:dienelactone hydrolase
VIRLARLPLTGCVVALASLLPGAGAQPPSLYEEDVPASNPIRADQARELDAYVGRLRHDTGRLASLLKPDYSSARAYSHSVRPYREAFARSIGYPPPGQPDPEPPVFRGLGEDALGTYYRASLPVLPGVHAVGIYIVPRNLKGRAPLVISMHGGGGSPEVALFHGGANYHDMVRGGVRRGYVVWAPTHLFSAAGFPSDVRNRTDERMRLVGTSLTAVEIAKITRSLDHILKRPEVDPKRVAMVGLSYGGYYTLVTAALEPRIKAAVSSCYFGVQEGRYAQDELSVPSDFRFPDRFTLFNDPDLVALICPRPLLIQAGARDNPSHRETGQRLAPQAAQYYQRLGVPDRFRFLVFEGGHEWHDASGWDWIERAFGRREARGERREFLDASRVPRPAGRSGGSLRSAGSLSTPLASRLSPLAPRPSPLAPRLSPLASRLSPHLQTVPFAPDRQESEPLLANELPPCSPKPCTARRRPTVSAPSAGTPSSGSAPCSSASSPSRWRRG